MTIDLDVILYKDLPKLFQEQNLKDVWFSCPKENKGCNTGAILSTRAALPFYDRWLSSPQTHGACDHKATTQAGWRAVCKELNCQQHISFLPHETYGVCGNKRREAHFTHYNCLKDKVGKMKKNSDWLGEEELSLVGRLVRRLARKAC